MDGGRVRHELDLRVVAAQDRAVPGRLTAYEDGRWRLHLAGREPIAGDRDEGARVATRLLLRLCVRPAGAPGDPSASAGAA